MGSIWTEGVDIPRRERLDRDITSDAVVIGAGMAGILTAYQLKRQGLSVVVLEADKIGSGQTQNTTAKITSQHNLIYSHLTENVGKEPARLYGEANEQAIDNYEKLIKEEGISCDFKRLPSYVYSLTKDDLEKEAEAAAGLGLSASFTLQTELPFTVKGAVRFENQAQFHPLKFLKEIQKKLVIYENTQVQEIEAGGVRTSEGYVKADHIVMATHFPFLNFPGYYFMRMHQSRSYAMALKNVPVMEGMYVGDLPDTYSFRSYEEYLILGGEGHRTGENTDGNCYEHLRKSAEAFYPECSPAMTWSAQDCITHDRIPFIGRYSKKMPHTYVITGFQKWGMSSSMVAADIISDLILEKKNPYSSVFTPQRFHLKASFTELIKDSAKAISGIGLEKLDIPDEGLSSIKPLEGGMVEMGGGQVGAYCDENGKYHIVNSICPHLGCNLAWNPDERTWDCPCHGSRFHYDGSLISGPAMEDLDYEE